MIWISLILIVGAIGMVSVGWMVSKPGYNGPKSDHFNGTTFENPGNGDSDKGFFDVMKWYMTRDQGEWTEIPDSAVTFAPKPADAVTNGLVITYVNHSTFLIQTAGVNILVDPVWSERVSPFSFAGPKRFRPPGVKFEDLPPINLVLLSHNHYDHLDMPSLKA